MRARRPNSVRRPVIKGASGLLRKWRNKYNGWILAQGKARRRVIAVATARSRNTALGKRRRFMFRYLRSRPLVLRLVRRVRQIQGEADQRNARGEVQEVYGQCKWHADGVLKEFDDEDHQYHLGEPPLEVVQAVDEQYVRRALALLRLQRGRGGLEEMADHVVGVDSRDAEHREAREQARDHRHQDDETAVPTAAPQKFFRASLKIIPHCHRGYAARPPRLHIHSLFSASAPQIIPVALFFRLDRPRPAPLRVRHGTRDRGIVRMEVDDEVLSGLNQIGIFYAIVIGGEDQWPPQGIAVYVPSARDFPKTVAAHAAIGDGRGRRRRRCVSRAACRSSSACSFARPAASTASSSRTAAAADSALANQSRVADDTAPSASAAATAALASAIASAILRAVMASLRAITASLRARA